MNGHFIIKKKKNEKTAFVGLYKYVSEEVLHKLTKCTEWRELSLLVTEAPRTSVLR